MVWKRLGDELHLPLRILQPLYLCVRPSIDNNVSPKEYDDSLRIARLAQEVSSPIHRYISTARARLTTLRSAA